MSASGETCSGLSWTYDIWANRTHQTTTGGTCGQSQLTINNLNRIVDTGYNYDAAGNLTADGSFTYQYDAENRLKTVNGGSVATYVYNAEGMRVRKTAGGTTTEYIYGPGGVVAEKVGSTWSVGYVYLNGTLLAQYSSNTTYFALKDHLGSTRVLTNVSGGVYQSYDYAPYGEGASGSGTTHKFTGKERDSESGLDYFGARYYISLSGRFLTPDLPLIDQQPGNPQSWNLYAYSRNNPLRFLDPTGNAAESPEPASSSPMEMGCGPAGCASPTTYITVDPEGDPAAGPDPQEPQRPTYLILVGDPGISFNQGNAFNLAAETAASELRDAGNDVIVQRISSVQDFNAALTKNGPITGGVIYFGHSGLVPRPDRKGYTLGLAPGQASGPDTNISKFNVGTLSGKNLGKNATITLNGCNAGLAYGGEEAIAQLMANQLQRNVVAYEVGMFFSTNRSTPHSTPGATVPNRTPIYMLPEGRARPITFTPETPQ